MNILPLPVKKNKFGNRVADISTTDYYRQIEEEVLEAHEYAAIANYLLELEGDADVVGDWENDEAEELVDIITCCITRLDILGFDENKRQELFHAVNEKNRKRGYFDD